MLLYSLETGAFAANCYLAACEQSRRGILIDPGADAGSIIRLVREKEITVAYLVCTHGHIDHIGAAAAVREALGAPLYIHQADSDMLRHPHDALGFYGDKAEPAQPDGFLEEGCELACGSFTLKVLSTPGHSPGSVCLYGEGVLFSGDTLFAGSIGRTDFPGGDFGQIISSIKTKLLVLPEETVVYPGHGPATTIAEEKRYNPFLR
jgi:hydroxyacylglutathione hydrolase